MAKPKKAPLRNKKIYRAAIALFVLLCIVISFCCFLYYLRLQTTVKAESQGYMQEIAQQMGTNINKNIDNNFALLQTIGAVLKNSNVTSYSQMQKIVGEHQKLWHFQKILLIDKNGATYDDQGNSVILSNDSYLQEVIVHDMPSLSSSQIIDGKESVVFAIPIKDIAIKTTTLAALAVSYDLNTFDQMLAMTAFEGKGYAHIIGSDGVSIVRSSSPDALETGYNILNSLSDAKFQGGKSLDEVKAEIESGQSGQAEFTLDGMHKYVTYIPLGAEKWSLLTFVPVEVVNARSNTLMRLTLLLCGFITIFFAVLIAILFVTFYRNRQKLEQIAYVDSVTDGNTINRFYELAQNLLAAPENPQYALVYTNIEKFKVLNEQFGRKVCDDILRTIQSGISSDLDTEECMGRWFADNFCILIKSADEAELAVRFEQWYKNFVDCADEKKLTWPPLIIAFGVYAINNIDMPFPHMIDRAKLALNEAAKELHGNIRYAIYDEQVRRLLFREKQLEDWMGKALENHEFQMYLQPKYSAQTEKISGAEALVRWASTSEGMIYPDEFIPLFEKNGFVIPLDFFMFEEVCKTIKGWISRGITPVKVSVNCSRLHLSDMDFLKKYNMLADQYQVPHALLEIELTESAVFENVASLSDIIQKIRAAGFGCSMDDFGSGYSSLNLIQDIPVDTLKLDKIFFRNTRDMRRSESVVGSIIAMSKALSMETVAEGVEEREQVDMLKRLGCDYLQGYYYAKPMPVSEFEQLAFESKSAE